MAISTQIQNLNLIPGKSAPVVVHLSQGNVGNTVQFYLYDGDNPYYPTNVSIAVHGVRADSTVFGPYAVSTTSGSNLVSFNIVTAMTSVNGAAIGELVITDSNQNQIGSANFGMLVEATPYSSSVTYEDDLSIYQRILAYVKSFPATVSEQISNVSEQIETVNTNVNDRITNLNGQLVTTNTRIDNIISPSGQAPSAAEVTDARIGANGVTYGTLGTAIRTQVGSLNSALDIRTGAISYPAGVGTISSDSKADKSKIYIVDDATSQWHGRYMKYNSLKSKWEYSDEITPIIDLTNKIETLEMKETLFAYGDNIVPNAYKMTGGYDESGKPIGTSYKIVFYEPIYCNSDAYLLTVDDSVEMFVCAWKGSTFTRTRLNGKSYVIRDVDYFKLMYGHTSYAAITDVEELNSYVSLKKLYVEKPAESWIYGDNVIRKIQLKHVGSTRIDSYPIYNCNDLLISSDGSMRFNVTATKDGTNTEFGWRYTELKLSGFEYYTIMFRRRDDQDVSYEDVQKAIVIKQKPYEYPNPSVSFYPFSMWEFASVVNGEKFSKKINSDGINLRSEEYLRAQVPSFEYLNGRIYATYAVNKTDNTEDFSKFETVLNVFDPSNPSSIARYSVIKVGDSIDGFGAFTHIADPACFLDGTNIVVVFAARISEWGLYYKVFDTNTSEFTSAGICKLSIDGVPYNFSVSIVNAALKNVKWNLYGIPDQTIIISPKYSDVTENGIVQHYTGLGCSGRFGAIVKSSDFKNWVYVAEPSFQTDTIYEPIVLVKNDVCHYFCRQDRETGYAFYTRYYLTTNVWDKPVFIRDCSSRGDFISVDDSIYLVYSPMTRNVLNWKKIEQYSMDSNDVQSAYLPEGAYYTFSKVCNGVLYGIFPRYNFDMIFTDYTIQPVQPMTLKSKFDEVFGI